MMVETSFVLNLWAGEPKAVAKARELDESEEPIYIPTPVLFELWEGVARSHRPRDEIEKIRHFVESHDILPFSDVDAQEAGLISGKMSGTGRTMGTVDVQLSGMAKARGLALLTFDKRFRDMSKEIDVVLIE